MADHDYIILGAGASGLMLAYRMALDTYFEDKSILIIDKDKDKGNDRTWCYWEEGKGEWDNILHKSWPKIYFGSKNFSKTIDLQDFNYKMVRSQSLYNLLWDVIDQKPNINFINDEVKAIDESQNNVKVLTSKKTYEGKKVFNSIANPKHYNNQKKYPVLQQHFVGWFIKTKTNQFDDRVATFMDFSVSQNGNTRFMYVLPLEKNIALFEYTLFSEKLLKFEEYENAIADYLAREGITEYEIVEKEKGSIPMTSFKFSKLNSSNVLNIGTAGGWTKASTGYTFRNTTKKTKELLAFLKHNNDLSKFHQKTKFWWYDLLFLDVLDKHNGKGSELFASLFKNAKTRTILRFLDEESSLSEDLSIITSVPPKQFLTALFKRLF
ncbi:lycopene cyclase family protein [Winogradskyella alexanderae]|uniref:Lycopene cyclase n=1 Tax=Winogradskyella alexanderae TaxID=2877123 RepID=A0ABS7XQR0_9FLAO|nr:lycopene cyclase family protein [Winogradskyella alexanderae]MCA0132347.1 lycopene cyclase [Winogradskyella alexanderae]